ncbi:unnamed protein product, partial [Brenthis ino]
MPYSCDVFVVYGNAKRKVTYVTPFPKEKVHNLEYVHISSTLESTDRITPSDVDKDLVMETLGVKVARQALRHPDMQALMMNDTVHFDVIIAEWFYSGLLAPLSSVFDCPLFWYTHNDISWKSLALVHGTVPAPAADLSIKDRLYEMMSQLHLAYRNYYHFSTTEMSAYEDCYRVPFESKRIVLPNYEFLVYNASGLLINSHALFGDKWSLPPNAKYIGGHHLSDRIPQLQKNLKKLMDDSIEGVIYVELETYLIKHDIHQNLIQELTEAFAGTKLSVILKYDEILLNLPKNVHIMRNPPAQSILSHPNTLLFVSHGDMAHIIAAVHHSVPLMGIPVLPDQASNIDSIVRQGFAIRVDVNEVSWKVEKGIKKIISNTSYRENIESAKAVLRHRLTSPKEDFLHWLQVFTLPGAAHLRPSERASVVERYNLDILLLILLILWFCSKLIKLCNAHLYSDEDVEKKEA